MHKLLPEIYWGGMGGRTQEDDRNQKIMANTNTRSQSACTHRILFEANHCIVVKATVAVTNTYTLPSQTLNPSRLALSSQTESGCLGWSLAKGFSHLSKRTSLERQDVKLGTFHMQNVHSSTELLVIPKVVFCKWWVATLTRACELSVQSPQVFYSFCFSGAFKVSERGTYHHHYELWQHAPRNTSRGNELWAVLHFTRHPEGYNAVRCM